MAKMTFEEITTDLNSRGFFWHQVAQIKDGKGWSVVVRKKGKWVTGSGQDKDLYKATKAAIKDVANQMTDKDWKKVIDKGVKPRKKRVRISKSRRR